MKKSRIVIALLVATLLLLVYLYNGHPVLLNNKQQEVVALQNANEKEFNPLSNIDFSSGNNVAYLVFSKQDEKELPKEMPGYRLLECTDNAVLKEMQSSFSFTRTNSDMATCDSKLLIYKDKKLVFQSAFVVSENVIGMQNSIVGWAEPADNRNLKKAFMQFRPVKKLFVNFN